MHRRRYLRTVAVAVAAATFAGCTGGGNDDTRNGDVATPTATPTEPDDEETPTATDDGTPAGTETPSGTPTATPPGDPEQRVSVENTEFTPESFEIAVGDTVLWEWVDPGHNVKYDEGAVPADTTWEGTRGDRTTTYGAGHAHWHTFEVAGEYEYYCVPHRSNGMRGSFTVVA